MRRPTINLVLYFLPKKLYCKKQVSSVQPPWSKLNLSLCAFDLNNFYKKKTKLYNNLVCLYQLWPSPVKADVCRIVSWMSTGLTAEFSIRYPFDAGCPLYCLRQTPKPKQVFFLQTFCGNSAKLLRKYFVNFEGFANFCLG